MSDWFEVPASNVSLGYGAVVGVVDVAEWDSRFADALIIRAGCIPPRQRSRFGAWLYTKLTGRPT